MDLCPVRMILRCSTHFVAHDEPMTNRQITGIVNVYAGVGIELFCWSTNGFVLAWSSFNLDSKAAVVAIRSKCIYLSPSPVRACRSRATSEAGSDSCFDPFRWK